MEMLLSLFTLVPLGVLAVSDIRSRTVSTWWLLVFGALLLFGSAARTGWDCVLLRICGNCAVLFVVGCALGFYAKIRRRGLPELLGSGDLLFLVLLSPASGTRAYVRFMLVACVLGLACWPIFKRLQPEMNGIPMVSVMAVCFVCVMAYQFAAGMYGA